MHGTLGNIVRALASPDQSDWDLVLGYAAFAINTSKPRTTKTTPFMLMHGREPRTVLDATLDTPTPRPLAHAEWFERLKKARMLAATADGEARGCNQAEPPVSRFNRGDLVLVKFTGSRPGRSTKLAPRQQGPFRVTDIEHGVTALLENVPSTRQVATPRLPSCSLPRNTRLAR